MQRSTAVWIGQVLVPDPVEVKLRNRRGITGNQVRAACEWPAVVAARWSDHQDHGRRLIVHASDEQRRRLKIVLQPVDEADGTWILKTAVVVRRAGAS